MTDDRRFYVLGKGRLIFDSEIDRIPPMFPGDEIKLAHTIPLQPHVAARFAELFGHDPVPSLIGYDAQKLLPSPQHFGREPMSFADMFIHNVGHSLGLTYAEIAGGPDYEEPQPTRWKKAVIVVGDALGNIGQLIRQAAAMPHVLGIDIDIQPSSGYLPPDLFLPRWNDPDATPLEDISRFIDNLNLHERFHAVNPNHQMRTYALGMMFGKPAVKPVASKPQKGYLKHDPTKQHKRRRR